jgi:hypothetical protein
VADRSRIGNSPRDASHQENVMSPRKSSLVALA